MSEPVSWLALELIRTMVQGITVDAGYFTDLGAGTVTLDTGLQPDPGQTVTLIAATEITVDEAASGTRVTRAAMDVLIEFHVPYDVAENAELAAHRARADIVRALRAGTRGRDSGITRISITGSRIGSPEESAGVVIAQVTARVDLTETSTTTP